MFVVSKISAVKIKLLAKQVLQQARGDAVDEQKLQKLLGDGKLDAHEAKGVIASLHFILSSSARYDVEEDVLTLELQQLGLPNEHTEALVLALREGRAALQAHLADISLALPKLESLRWRVVEDPGPAHAHAVELQLATRAQPPPGAHGAPPAAPSARTLEVRLSTDTLTLLQTELKEAREMLPDEQPR